MTCPRCNSEHTRITVLTETKLQEKKPGIFLSLIWLLLFVLWLIVSVVVYARGTLLAAPILLVLILSRKKQVLDQTHYAAGVCQDCGNVWFP